jgi:hypothetical protein
MATDIDPRLEIVNLAMAKLGMRRLKDIDATTDAGQRVIDVWDLVRRDVLAAQPWGFASAIIPLAEDGDATVLGWTNVYDYPRNCIAVRRIFSEAAPGPHPFRKLLIDTATEPKIVLVANIEDAYAEITYDVDAIDLFEPAFAQAMACRLAAELAKTLIGDEAVAEKKRAECLRAFDIAAARSAGEGRRDPKAAPTDSNPYFDAR